jgi:hypothetical protein
VRFAASVTATIHGKDYLAPIIDAPYRKPTQVQPSAERRTPHAAS